MPPTQLPGSRIADGSVQRQDLDAVTAGSAVIRKVLAGQGVLLNSTGPDAGTGDVTVNASMVGDNLVPNGSFELGMLGWSTSGAQAGSGVAGYVASADETKGINGSNYLVLDRSTAVSGTHGTWALGTIFDVEEGATYDFSAYLTGSEASSADILVRLTWYSASYANLGYQQIGGGNGVTTSRVERSIRTVAPANARRASVSIYNYLTSTCRYLYVDGVSVRKVVRQGPGSNLDADTLDGEQGKNIFAGLRANANLHGGGTITTTNGAVKWSQRFIFIGDAAGTEAPSGSASYLQIVMPNAALTVPVLNGSPVTIIADGIPLASWRALYYDLSNGSAIATSTAGFTIVDYTLTGNFCPPPDWVLIAAHSSDQGLFHFGRGLSMKTNQSWDTTIGLVGQFNLKAPLASPTFTGTVSGITKAMVGLGNVDNTSDAAKPVSTATQTALNLKANLASPTFTGTVSGITKAMVGLGNVDNTSDAAKPVSTATQTALNLKANLASPTFTGTVSGITKAMVGLGNVDNTSDANKPVSTAQQTALNLKANLASPTFTGTVSGITKAMVGLGNVDNTSDAAKPVSTAQQTALDLKQNLSERNQINGYAGLNASAQIEGSAVPPIKRGMLDVTNASHAVIAKVIAGTGITISSTGSDAGTGDVTINASSNVSTASGSIGVTNAKLVASVASNALTIALKHRNGSDPDGSNSVFANFLNASGEIVTLTISAAMSLVISSGSTMGASNNQPLRLWVALFNDGGTARLAAINCRNTDGIFPLHQHVEYSSTAEGGAGGADARATFYSGSAVAAKYIAVIGFLEWPDGLSTAGTWNAAPSRVVFFAEGVPLPGEVVREYYSGTGGTSYSTTANNYVDVTSANVTLTPTSKCNGIYLQANWTSQAGNVASVNNYAYGQFLRDSTVIWGPTSVAAPSGGGGVGVKAGMSLNILDFPEKAASTVYKLQHAFSNTGGSVSSLIFTAVAKEIMG